MKLTRDTEIQKKEQDGKEEKGKGFSKSPMAEKLRGKVAALVLAAAVPALVLSATSSSCTMDNNGVPVEQVDGGHDGGHDAGPDADGGHDAGPDADGGHDVDAGEDAGYDGGTDADAGPVACATATTGSFNDVMNIAVPISVGGYTFEYFGPSSGEALIDITCGGNGVETGLSYPAGLKTTVSVAIDNKNIEITPHTVTTSWVDVRIDVLNP